MGRFGEEGQTMSEYTVILSALVLALVFAYGAFGDAVLGMFQRVTAVIGAL